MQIRTFLLSSVLVGLTATIGVPGPSLPDELLKSSTEVVSIPLQRGVESLNVATAAAVLTWVLGSRS